MELELENKGMYRQVWKALLLIVCALFVQIAMAMPDIRVHGLFGKSAVLVINGKQRLLKQGQTSPEGLR